MQAQEQAPPPTTDADAQAALAQEGQTVDPATVKARLTEEGTRVQEAPQFAVPQTTNIINNTVINNTVINNTTNNTESEQHHEQHGREKTTTPSSTMR